MQTAQALYPTRPLRCWQKCKELRLKHYQEVARARELGKVLVGGSAGGVQVLSAGLGDYIYMGGESYGASIGGDPAFSAPCLEATEAAGYGRDVCVYFRNEFGSLLLDRYYFGGPFPKFDLFLQSHICDNHAKWYQAMAERLGVPFFAIDHPSGPWGEGRFEQRAEYFAQQCLDAIEWLERTTGRKYDDSLLVQAIINEYEASRYWAEVCLLNQTIPAPLDQKSMLTLFLPNIVLRGSPQCVEFYRGLRDEVQERVDDGIAALATERFRYLHEGIPPWHFLKVFRLLEHYGAISVGSLYQFCMSGQWDIDGQGLWHAPRPFQELGVRLGSREEAVRFFARSFVGNIQYRGSFFSAAVKSQQVLQIYRQWQAQGVVMHLNRGCKGTGGYMLENRLALLEAGIPVVTYEGNAADRREFDEAQAIDRLESFMESLGLEKLDSL